MAIKYFEDDWRILVLTQDIPARTEEEESRHEHTNVEEAGKGERQTHEVPVPKKLRTCQTKTKKTK
jgi:hypothetical protein